ncbi:IS110 family transposase [Agromyces sp. NPDC058484]|uniref:IS110 family transposase n=1 Tax=Agromyces sp. NPDC058484 TaxID=3346524 RepID=UPI003669B24C
MDVVHERAAGIDISKRDAKVAVRVPGKQTGTFVTTVTTWGATTSQVLELIDVLTASRVTVVVMEATSDYWKPFYYLMEDTLPVMLVNAKQARNIPGRKTDVSDAAWLAQLAAHGLLRTSFVPPEPVRQLRDLTRARTLATRDMTRVEQRLEKFLESSGIKLSAVVSELTGVSGRLMLEALADGERDPVVLADLAKGVLRNKIPQLEDALVGRFTEHHAFMVHEHLNQIEQQQAMIDRLTERIEEAILPFQAARDVLVTIPGVSVLVADVIIAETGADMTMFETAAHLASWAGVCPGQNESAGKMKSSHTTDGNKYLKGALGVAALAASHSKGTFLAARYRRLVKRRGKPRAIVAIQHSILTAAWHMLRNGEAYDELGADYYTQRDPQRTRARAIRDLEALGYNVVITPVAA